MARSYISVEIRRFVADRADYLCEYCLIAEEDRLSGCHVDHIISVKHGGSSTPENLCYACIFCNLQKGTDLGSINWKNGELVRFFNPRRDFWGEHFTIEGARIRPLTEIGEVTERILDFNPSDRILERELLIKVSRYSSIPAQKRIRK
jgi:HNH endonuclease